MRYVLVPGAWTGAWVWEGVASRLRRRGHDVLSITLPGLEDGDDAASVGLATHVQAVFDRVRVHELEQVVLVGHSYSGLVVGQVAAQAACAIARTVYVEAFLPVDGQSLFDVSGLDVEHERSSIVENAGLWPPPTREELRAQGSLSVEQVERLAARLHEVSLQGDARVGSAR
jgi:pimeloyl-ACP methyl ester carboxylesterase